MSQEFEIRCVVSEEGVPGGLKVDAKPKSYNRYHKLFEAARDVRKIDDFRELRIPHYPAFRPFEYQREAVLMMLSRFRGKGIFGDQVGLGKTVEVGMTVAEYAERGAVKNVLLLCPKKLDFQWEQEIAEKFHTHFDCVLVPSFAQMTAHEKSKKAGVTMYIMTFDVILKEIKNLKNRLWEDIVKGKEWLEAESFKAKKSDDYYDIKRAAEQNETLYRSLDDEIDDSYLKLFDAYASALPQINMLVVDEADALLSTDPNKTLQIYRVVEHIGKNTSVPYKILMSATPIRRQLADVYKLMKIVRPEQFRDMDDFIRNYCFGKPRLNDFKGEELRQLKGLIDQLFTRNRLTSSTVQWSLKPLTIEEVLDLNFENFSAGDFETRVREAVIDGICYGEQNPERTRANIETSMRAYLDEGDGLPRKWTEYVRAVILNPRETPVRITDEKNLAFAESLYTRIRSDAGAEADALRFACEDYVIPAKRGHHIRYKGEIAREKYDRMSEKERAAAEKEAYDDALTARAMRKARAEFGYAEEAAGTTEYYDRENIDCDGKYAEFDRLVNELLPEEKVLVFSDAGAERNMLIRLVESAQKGRALNGAGDTDNKNYLKFRSDAPQNANAVYFAVNGEEKGFNMQFCSNLIITNLSHDPNLVEQIVGRISRIGQRKKMHVYVFTPMGSLEYSLYLFYNDVLHLFSDWDGDNTFIIGGAVASYLEENPSVEKELMRRIGKKHTADGEKPEIGFPQIVEYLWEQYDGGFSIGTFEDYEPWIRFKENVAESIDSFRELVKEMGDQIMFTADEQEVI